MLYVYMHISTGMEVLHSVSATKAGKNSGMEEKERGPEKKKKKKDRLKEKEMTYSRGGPSSRLAIRTPGFSFCAASSTTLNALAIAPSTSMPTPKKPFPAFVYPADSPSCNHGTRTHLSTRRLVVSSTAPKWPPAGQLRTFSSRSSSSRL